MSESNGLPIGWIRTTLTCACVKIQDGTHFSPKNQYPIGEFRYITAKNIRPSGLDLADVTFLNEVDHREINQRCDPRKGDVLLVKDGVNTGDAATNTLDEEISLLSSVCMLRPDPKLLLGQYLRYYLLSPVGQRELTGQMTGTAIKRIILKKVKGTSIQFGPLSEQRRIVAKIEELFSDLDAGVAALKWAKANLTRYRAAVLKAAVEGRLTAEWRAANATTEPASKLLDRILAERRRKWEAGQLAKYAAAGKTPPKGWRDKYAEPKPPETDGLPELPEGWRWTTCDALIVRLDSGSTIVPTNDVTRFPVLRSSSVRPCSVDLDDVRYVPDGTPVEDTAIVKDGDLLFVRLSGSLDYVACCGVVRRLNGRRVAYPDRIFRAIPVLDSLASFVELCFASAFVRKAIATKAKSTAGHQRVSMGAITEQAVPLPPLAEQGQIVAEVERRLSVVAATDAQIDADLKRAARLRQSILKRAFEGKLVPQDPNDEPAEKLLERIRARRADDAEPGPGRRPTRRRARID